MNNTVIKLPNGQTAVSFVPQDSKELAIVHLSTLKQLAELLPKASTDLILQELENRIGSIRVQHNLDNRLEVVTELCSDFINFHQTINLIREYKPEPVHENH